MTQHSNISLSSFSPPAEIFETKSNIILKVELPGLTLKDVSIQVKKNQVAISGEREFGDDSKFSQYHRMERGHGKFFRTFEMPHDVEDKQLAKSLDKGVLELRFRK